MRYASERRSCGGAKAVDAARRFDVMGLMRLGPAIFDNSAEQLIGFGKGYD